jgi:hypothetical protein
MDIENEGEMNPYRAVYVFNILMILQKIPKLKLSRQKQSGGKMLV